MTIYKPREDCELHLFKVTCSHIPITSRTYRTNEVFGVVTDRSEKAIEHVINELKAKNSRSITVWSVSHCGQVDILDVVK